MQKFLFDSSVTLRDSDQFYFKEGRTIKSSTLCPQIRAKNTKKSRINQCPLADNNDQRFLEKTRLKNSDMFGDSRHSNENKI